MVAIIDYGAGNLRSVQKAFAHIGTEAKITNKKEEILSADHVILPGVGAFGDCMNGIHTHRLDDCIHQVIENGTPFLGICLGLQLLFEGSDETPDVKGLGILAGNIKKIPNHEGLKIPHMGWNSISIQPDSRLFANLPAEPFVYFVHSYYMVPKDPSIISAVTTYGSTLPIALERENLFATQFHPEKSGETGLQILKNFINTGRTK